MTAWILIIYSALLALSMEAKNRQQQIIKNFGLLGLMQNLVN